MAKGLETAMKVAQSRKRALTIAPARFEILLTGLHPDREVAGLEYVRLRAVVVKFLEVRRVAAAEEWADVVLDRLARKVEIEEKIDDIRSYALGIARNVAREADRDQNRFVELSAEPNEESYLPEFYDSQDEKIICCKQCLMNLPAEQRRLIIEYYDEDGGAKIDNRKTLAAQFGIELNALRIRAHRLRVRIENCINECTNRLSLNREGK